MRVLCINIPHTSYVDPNVPELVVGNEYFVADIKPASWLVAKQKEMGKVWGSTPAGNYYQLKEFPRCWYHEYYFGLLDSGIEEEQLELIHKPEHGPRQCPSRLEASRFLRS